VIRFRDTKNRPNPPPWLAGAPNLHRRQSAEGELWMCGEALYLDGSGTWTPIGDGYEVAGPVESWAVYQRTYGWVDLAEVTDMCGRTWMAPRILNESGERAFRVHYGADFLPSPTAEQYRMMEIADAARDALRAAAAGTQEVPMQMACRWAAELLGTAYRLPVDAIAVLGILDDVLTIGVINVGAAVEVEVAP
jgi:hypothetical protein